MLLNIRQVKSLFDARTWERGVSYAQQGRVSQIRHDADGKMTASVRGSGGQLYSQAISLARGGQDMGGRCSCPVGINCKHVAAVCYMFASGQSEYPVAGETMASNADHRKPTPAPELPPALLQWLGLVRSSQSLDQDPESWQANVRDRLLYVLDENANGRLTVETMKTSLLKSGGYSATARRYDTHRLMTTGYDAPKFVRPQDLRIVSRLRLLGLATHPGYYGASSASAAGEIFSLLELIARTGRGRWREAQGPILSIGGERRGRFRWETQANGSQKLVLVDGEGKRLHPLPIEPPAFIDTATGEIGHLLVDGPAHVFPILLKAPVIAPQHTAKVVQALHEMGMTEVPKPTPVETEVRRGGVPTPVLTLFSARATRRDGYGWGSTNVRLPALRLAFDYDGRMVKGVPGGEEWFLEDGRAITLLRNGAAERRAYELLEGAGARFAADIVEKPAYGAMADDLYLPDPGGGIDDLGGLEPDALDFMAKAVPQLKAGGWRIEIAQDWPFPFYDGPVEIRAGAAPQGKAGSTDWFAFDVQLVAGGHRLDLMPTVLRLLGKLDFLDPDDEDWQEAMGAVLEELNFYPQLEDGRYVALDAPSLIPLMRVFLSAAGLLDGFHRAEAGRAHQVIEALEGCGIAFDGGQELLALGRKLQALAQIPETEPPAGFHGELRPYQQKGYGWLRALRESGFGGVLADDMGLGKTVQTLAFLASHYTEKDAPARPTLLVVPTSLVHTWRRQALSFAPGLKVLALHGRDRKKDFEAIDDHDLVITTYALFHRDHDVLVQRQWDIVILDEAQAAKNPASRIAKAIRSLDSRIRLALTGTPTENSLMDLWTLFDWLIPGLLGDRKSFRSRFLAPIENRGGDARAQMELNARIRPFILRRTKQQVAIDLPEKTEITELVPLGERQSSVYEAVRLAMDERVRRAIAEKGLAASHITILDALLKLRQICCDPRLVKHDDMKDAPESAKRERLIELLSNLVAEGRRVLVFSQFVEMLNLIEADILEKGWSYARLTGSTTNRDEVVDGFQNGDAPIFLISLKAGGVGLTLTAADTVILYDPWWNPAVERQAMDRVHRIGQERKVFVYRLIAEGSVEEAISRLQERKQAMADALFEGGESNPFVLDEGEIAALFRPLASTMD